MLIILRILSVEFGREGNDSSPFFQHYQHILIAEFGPKSEGALLESFSAKGGFHALFLSQSNQIQIHSYFGCLLKADVILCVERERVGGCIPLMSPIRNYSPMLNTKKRMGGGIRNCHVYCKRQALLPRG